MATLLPKSIILISRLTATCCSGVNGGIAISLGKLIFFPNWAGGYDSSDCENSESRKYREGHSAKTQSKSCIAGRSHRKGNLRSFSFMRGQECTVTELQTPEATVEGRAAGSDLPKPIILPVELDASRAGW